jgi:ferric-dicitrate binding protein FerR (iron transport regulator)
MREVRTANGQKAVITLSDGTRVHLNSGSVLRFPRAFPSASREVRLEGEAFFQVAHDSLRPFSVRTAAATATVLGTAFDVRAYPEDPVTTVAVVEGRVRFAASATSGSSLLMTAGHLGRHRAGTDSLSLMALRNGDFPAWKDNDLVFADQPLSEIARTLERWYGIRVEIRSQALSRTRFTGRYHKPRLHDLIRDMSQVTRFRFTYGNRTLILEQP